MDFQFIGQEIYRLIESLYPICRSITGDGFRESMRILKDQIPLELHEDPFRHAGVRLGCPTGMEYSGCVCDEFEGRKNH